MLVPGKMIESRSADPLPIVRHAMAVCQELAIPVRAQIGYEGPAMLPRVRMSPTELTQVLINVVANGAQAVAVHADVDAELVPAQRVVLQRLQVVRLQLAEVPRALVVIQDVLAVQLVHH